MPPTVRDPQPAPERWEAGESHTRLRAVPAASIDWLEAHDLLDELGEEQLALGVNLSVLEQAVALAPRQPSTRGAIDALERRVLDLVALRDALTAVHVAAVDRSVQRVFVPDAVLADYLRGLYAWGHALVRALEVLATDLRRPANLDWALVRFRLEEAKNFYFDDLEDPIRADLASLPPGVGRDDLVLAIEHLFHFARGLEAGSDERFTT